MRSKLGKIVFVFLFFCIFGLTTVNADTKKIVIDNISVKEKSGTITVVDPVFENNEITSSIIFNEKDDFVTYELTLTNKENSKYKIESIKDNNKYSNIKIDYVYDDNYIESGGTKKIEIKLSYKNKIINAPAVDLNDLTITLKLVNGDGDSSNIIINPKTGDNIIFYLYLLIIAITGLIYFVMRKKNNKFKALKYMLVAFILFTPLFILALDKYEVSIKFTDIKLSSEYEKYNIVIDLGDGSEPITKEITYGDPIGNLPQISDKNGYDNNGWKDNDNNPVTEDTIITKPITITPDYTPIKYSINYNLDGGSASNPSTYTIEDEIVLNNPEKAGYSFSGWTGSNGDNLQTRVTIEKGSTGNKEFNANFKAGTDTPYKVIHKYQKIDGDSYTEEVENLTGTTDTKVTPALKGKNGFKSPNVQELTITGDGKASITYVYTREKYTFEITDRTNIDNTSTPNGKYYYETEIKVKAIEKAGYDFKWNDGSTNLEKNFILDSNTSLTPIYTARTNTPYKVVHKLMNLDGRTYTDKDIFEKTGTTDEEVTPAVNTYDGFTSPSTKTVTISGSGDTVIEYLYERNKYQVVLNDIQYIETDATSGDYYYDSKVTVKAKDRAGYTFEKWSNGDTNVETTITITGPITITPIYTTNGDTPYTVIHKQMNLDGEYVEVDRDNLKGTTGSEVTPYVNTYEGFTSPETQTVTISGEGNTVVEYLYERNKYTLNITNRDNLDSTSTPNGKYYYDTTITLKANEIPGYEFKWSDNNDPNYERTFKLKNDFTATPVYTAKTNTSYTVIHKKMDLDGEHYTTAEEENLTGTTDSEVTPDVRNYTGFTSPSTKTVTISGEGNTVVEYLYTRNKYTLTIEDNEYVKEDKSGKYYYDEEVSIEAKDRNGYNFVKWSNNETTKKITLKIGTSNITVKPIYEERTDTTYTVVHKKMNVNGSGYTTFETESLTGTTNDQVTPSVKNYYGFTSPSTKTVTISGEGDTTVEYLYTRNKYTLTINNENYVESTKNSGKYYYETEITLKAKDRNGYKFVKWSNDYTDSEITITLDRDITIEPIYEEKTDTPYTVVHKKMNLDGEHYTTAEEENLTGTTNQEVTPSVKNYTGFTSPSTKTVTISAEGNTTVEYLYTRNKYNLILEDTNYIVEGDISGKYYYETEITLTAKDVDGKTFVKWSNGETTKKITITINDNSLTLKPIYDNDTYTITFVPNGGVVSEETRVIDQGDKIGTLPIPTREGYYFDGWYTSLDFDNKIDENTIPVGEVSYYANWKKSVESMNISNPNIEIKIDDEETINITNKDEIEEDYTFTSNNTAIATVDENGKVTGISEGETTITITGSISGTTKVINIKINTNKYKITFDTNGGNSIADREVIIGSKIGTLPQPVRENYIFDGWYETTEFINIVNDEYIPNSDTTIYAKWRKSIAFANISNTDITLNIGGSETINITNKNEIEEEYVYASSNTSIVTVDNNGNIDALSSGKTTIIITGTESNLTKTVNVTVLKDKITITFNPNGGTVSPKTIQIDQGTAIGELPVPAKSENIFIGWYMNPIDGLQIDENTIPEGDVTYYAKWLRTVEFVEIDNPNITVTKNETESINLKYVDEIQEELSFVSNDESIATVDNKGVITGVNKGQTKITITGLKSNKQVEINVLVLPLYYDVEFDSNGGSEVKTIKVEENTTVSELPVTYKQDNKFIGWYTDILLSTPFDSNSPITSNITLYAKWEESIENPFKTVFYEPGTCEFYEYDDERRVSGNNCENRNYYGYIDTGINLYNSTNHDKDYEIGFTIDNYNSSQVKQATLMNTKLEGNGYPGVVFRRKDATDNYELGSRKTSSANATANFDTSTAKKVKIYRIYNESKKVQEIYYSIGDGEKILVNNLSSFNPEFDFPVWFGAAPTDIYGYSAQRYFNGSMSNMYIKLGKYNNKKSYIIRFYSNRGSLPFDMLTIDEGNKIGQLPSLPTYSNLVFAGWYTEKDGKGTKIDENTIPTSNATYYAHWIYTIGSSSISKTQYNMIIGQKETITINSSSSYEPVTYESNNPLVATVDENGEITATGVGTATITLRGLYSNSTKEVYVKVTNNLRTVTFNPTGGVTDVSSIVVEGDVPVGDLPTPTKEGYYFDGWYTDEKYPAKVNSTYIVTKDITCNAKWVKDITNAIYEDPMEIHVKNTTNFTIDNADDIEPFTLSADEDSEILRVYSSSNSLYGYIEGEEVVTITGKYSNKTTSLNVSVFTEQFSVKYVSNGGTEYEDAVYNYGDYVRNFPTPTKENYIFTGWYTDKFYTNQITYINSITTNYTLYAKWEYDDPFKLVFNHPNSCTFNGEDSTISGYDCQYRYNNYIDTGVELYNSTNYDKDYEIGFTIEDYYPSNNTASATIMNEKYEDGSKYPGIVFRRSGSSDNFEVTETLDGNKKSATIDYSNVRQVRIFRINKKIYYSINNGSLIELQDTSNYSDRFTMPVWFGAAPKTNSTYEGQRFFYGTLSNMYIKVGKYNLDNLKTITFNPNEGSIDSSYATRKVLKNTELGALPKPSRSGYTFIDWYTSLNYDTSVDENTIVTKDATYYAKWEPNYTVVFNSNGGTTINNRSVNRNATIGSLPTPTRDDYKFDGWYLEEEFENKVATNYVVKQDITLYAKWISTDRTIVDSAVCDYNVDVFVSEGTICKRAEVLHQEICELTSGGCASSGYSTSGKKGTNVVTYGNCGTDGKLKIGDAFTCDVNGDGTFDEKTERFYYVSDYFNTITKEYEDDTAVLIYYNNFYNGKENNNKGVRYSTNYYTYNGPTAAAAQLPTNAIWNNTILKYRERQMLNANNNEQIYSGSSSTLKKYDYDNHTARLLTMAELKFMDNRITVGYNEYLSPYEFLFENTRFANNDAVSYYWIEGAPESSSGYYYGLTINSGRSISTNSADSAYPGVRPVIEVPKNKMYYGSIKVNHTLYLHSNGGILNDQFKVYKDGDKAINLPEPVREGYDFLGWYTSLDFDIKVDENTTITSDMHLYARWDNGTYTVTFDTRGGEEVEPYTRTGYDQLGELPIPVREGYSFNNWYDSNLNVVDPEMVITKDVTFYAYWDKAAECSNNKNITTPDGTICKRAETLHREKCSTTGSYYCAGAGYSLKGSKASTVITYGNCGTNGELKSGDAFTCDINGDGTFDEETERFYYVSDFYNPYTKEYDDKVATLIYYNNTNGNEPDSGSTSSYGSGSNLQLGPSNAAKKLPTDWNVDLYYKNRQIVNNLGDSSYNTVKYSKYYYNNSARLLTFQEVTKACDATGNYSNGDLDKCEYLLENTTYGSNYDSTITNNTRNTSYYLETVSTGNTVYYAYTVYAYNRSISSLSNGTIGVRPAIDVPKSKIVYGGNEENYKVTFDANGGIVDQHYKLVAKNGKIGELPDTLKEAYSLEGWYTELDGGTKVDENYVINGDITLYAHYTHQLLYDKVKYDALNTDTATKFEGAVNDTLDETDDEDIYYYNVSKPDNYAIFANYCWKVLRTTSDGGVKLIYYGKPNDSNQCVTSSSVNDGVINSKTNYKFNNNSTLYSVGYMYNKVSDISYSSSSSISNYLFGSSIEYDGTYYKLVNTDIGVSSERKYTCLNTSGMCSSPRYYITSTYYVLLNGTKNIDDYVNKSLTFNITDSLAKTTIDQWYEENLVNYDEYIDYDAIYCNDRSIYEPENQSDQSGWREYGTFNNNLYFNSNKKANPDLRCINITDKFSASNPKAKLKYPIGLVTKDERQLATNISNTVTSSMLMTPSYMNQSNSYIYYETSNSSYSPSPVMSSTSTSGNMGIKPAITLKNNVYFTSGDGSLGRPFLIYAESTEKYIVRFDPKEGVLSDNVRIVKVNEKIGNLPVPTKEGYIFDGWYTNEDYDEKISENTIPNDNETTYYAKWITDSYTVTFDTLGNGENTVITRNYKEELGDLPTISKDNYKFIGWFTTKDSLGGEASSTTLVTKDITYYPRFVNYLSCDNNQNTDSTKLCRRAKKLHRDQCNTINTSGCFQDGYYEGGSKDTDIITYGNCGTDGELNAGDAFTCDVNGDGVYDEETERFYYVSDYFNTRNKTYEKDTAVLIYYSNVDNNGATKYTTTVYNKDNNNYEGPTEAIKVLPTKDNWNNISMKEDHRQIITTSNNYYSGNYEFRLPTNFDYSDYNSRLLGYKEISQNCSSISECNFLLENTRYSSFKSIYGYWLENPVSSNNSTYSYTTNVETLHAYYYLYSRNANNNTDYGTRPVIEVNMDDIDFGVKYNIYFNPNGGVLDNDYLGLKEGETLGTLPTPTRSGYTFDGWYTGLTDGSKIEDDMTVTESATYYAHWTESAAVCSNNIEIKPDDNTVCIRAKQLKQEQCSSSSGYYCKGAGYTTSGKQKTTTITYGNCGTDGELTTGDAFICDVNNDGIYSETDERYYYVSDYYNTQTKDWDENVGVLIGASVRYDNNSRYDQTGANDQGPIDLLSSFRSNTQYRNTVLKYNDRDIINSAGTTLLRNFNYTNKAERLLTLEELKKACGNSLTSVGALDSCVFLFDNSYFASSSSNSKPYSIYLETPASGTTDSIYIIDISDRKIATRKTSYYVSYGNRPVIDVPKAAIKYKSNTTYHTTRFNANGGYTSQNYISTVDGNEIGTLPIPTREGYFFVGWYTDLDNNIEIKSTYIPTSETTVYAKWIIGNYTVSFESNGGSDVDDINIDGFEKIGELPVPVKEGHDFRGWAIENDSFDIATEDYVVTHDVKFYAMWTDYHTITFNSNNGEFAENVTENSVYYRSSPILERFYSHTTNLLDDGTKNTSTSYHYFNTKTDKIEFKFTNKFEIDLWYYLNSSYYSWLGIYPKDKDPDTSTSADDATISGGRLYGVYNQYSTAKPNDADLDHHKKFIVNDNSAYIHLYGNGSSMSSYYGYYAIISGRENVDVNNNYIEPTKSGATFLGWCTTSDCEEGTEFNLVTDQITNDITLYAKWGYKVSFKLNSGTSSTAYPRYIKEGDAIGTLPTISRSNYTFEGWYINESDDEAVTSEFVPTEDVELKAKWQANDYTVTFDSMGGSEVSSITKPYNEVIGDLPTPTKSDSTFKGWYTTLTSSASKISSSTKVTGNTTYYAYWNQNPTCSVNEDITTEEGLVCRRAKTLHQEVCNETSTSNYCRYAGYSSSYPKGATITYGNCGEKGKLNTGDAFTCDVNGDGTFDEETERFYYVNDYYETSSRKYEDDTAVLVYYTNIENKEPINTVSSGTPYNENGKPNSGPGTIAAKLPTKAEWSNVKLKYNNRYILAYNDTLSSSSSVLRYDYSNYGARFLSLKEIYDNCKTPSSSLNYNGGLSKCYYLMENTNNVVNPTRVEGYWLESPIYNYTSSKAWVIDGRARIYNGYTTEGFNTNYGVRPTIEVPKSLIDYGQETPYYTIYFNPNNGTLNQNYKSILSTEQVGTLPTPSRSEYKFIGWYTELDGGVQVDSSSTIDKNMTLYAHWVEIPKYRLTYDTQGGNEIESKLILENNTIGTLPTPTREGYRFLGWYDDPDEGNTVATSLRMTQDTTIYAHWIKQYTITFDSQGGSSISSRTLDENKTIGSYSIPNKEGYVFMGWYDDNENYENRYNTNTVITKDLTYYAKWHKGNACSGYESKTILYTNTCDNNVNVEVGEGIVCKRATTLHQEKCTSTYDSGYCSGSGYTLNGSKGTDMITYGSCGTQGVLKSGDAFTCDVNGDGEFNELTERFYYLSTKFNSIEAKWEDDTAVLVYYNNVNDGYVCNTRVSYATGGGNHSGPTSLYTLLPSTEAWPNVSLKYTNQQIYSSSGTRTSSYALPVFSYEGKAARLIQYKEANNACGNLGNDGGKEGALNVCNYLMESTSWAGTGSDYFLEAPCHQDNDNAWMFSGLHRYYGNQYVGSSSAARPVIDVPITKIQY